jgi:hypothetical protein
MNAALNGWLVVHLLPDGCVVALPDGCVVVVPDVDEPHAASPTIIIRAAKTTPNCFAFIIAPASSRAERAELLPLADAFQRPITQGDRLTTRLSDSTVRY